MSWAVIERMILISCSRIQIQIDQISFKKELLIRNSAKVFASSARLKAQNEMCYGMPRVNDTLHKITKFNLLWNAETVRNILPTKLWMFSDKLFPCFLTTKNWHQFQLFATNSISFHKNIYRLLMSVCVCWPKTIRKPLLKHHYFLIFP